MSESDQDELEADADVDPELLERFNRAATEAFEGRTEAALQAWESLLDVIDEDTPRSFVGEVRMRRCWVLMDLERYEEAAEMLATEAMEPYLDYFSDEVLFEYFFCHANTLGTLGRIEPMDGQFRRAMYVAAEHLRDMERCQRCWLNLLMFGEQAQDWEYLAKTSEAGQRFAEGGQLTVLGFIAGLHHAAALRGLGKLDEAREKADALLTQAQAWRDEDAIERVQALIAEMD